MGLWRLTKLVGVTLLAMLVVATIWGRMPEGGKLAIAGGTQAQVPELVDPQKAALTDMIAAAIVAPPVQEPRLPAPAKVWTEPAPQAKPATVVYRRENGLPVIGAAPASTETIAADAIAYVTGTRVNFREGPGTQNAVVDALMRGEAVSLIGAPENGWQRIRIEGSGGEGWIASKFLSFTQPG